MGAIEVVGVVRGHFVLGCEVCKSRRTEARNGLVIRAHAAHSAGCFVLVQVQRVLYVREHSLSLSLLGISRPITGQALILVEYVVLLTGIGRGVHHLGLLLHALADVHRNNVALV